ncbi:unnamed protein product, partial [Prorocentrum cordatum]
KLPRSGPRGPGAASLAMAALTVEYIKNQTGEFDEQSVFQAILSHRSIPRIADGASRCCNLRWLDLSHNAIIRIENLDGLAQLVCLDLSFNKVSKVENLQGMQSLERLWLKSNPVSRLSDLDGLESARQLRHLSLQNIDASDFCPVCLQVGYRTKVRELLPELAALDSKRSWSASTGRARQSSQSPRPGSRPTTSTSGTS